MDRHLKVKQILPYVARHRHTTASVSYSAAVALLAQTDSTKGERRVKGERVTSSSFQDVCTEHLVPRDSQARGTRCCTGWGWGHNLLKMLLTACPRVFSGICPGKANTSHLSLFRFCANCCLCDLIHDGGTLDCSVHWCVLRTQNCPGHLEPSRNSTDIC